jgi:hypothetical protein
LSLVNELPQLGQTMVGIIKSLLLARGIFCLGRYRPTEGRDKHIPDAPHVKRYLPKQRNYTMQARLMKNVSYVDAVRERDA